MQQQRQSNYFSNHPKRMNHFRNVNQFQMNQLDQTSQFDPNAQQYNFHSPNQFQNFH